VLSRPAQRGEALALPALALEAIRARLSGPEADADADLRDGPVLGRTALARQAAATLVGDGASPAAVAAGLGRLVAAGARVDLTWGRMAAERQRGDPGALGRHEGMLEAAALPLLLEERADLTMSASRFEDYAKCPQLFFFKRVLRLAVPDEAGRDVSALDRGTLVHEILERFHATVPAGLPRDDRERALAAVAADVLSALKSDGLFAEVYRELLLGGLAGQPDARPGLLRAYLDYEEGRAGPFEPALFEATFGPVTLFEARAPGGRAIPVAITGSIDRVDLDESGDAVRALVLDYKTGKVDDKRKGMVSGLLFQLPLYAHVLPALLADRARGRPVEVVGAAYYQVKSPAEVGIKQVVAGKADLKRIVSGARATVPSFAALVAASVERARAVVESFLAGRFHPTGLEGSSSHCGECDFRSFCRGRDEGGRIGRMDDPRRFPQVVALAGADDDEGDA
jgi:RecB family exonuclease